MTDIRKDFMAWFKAQAETQEECPSLLEAYQAGRAHGVDELIAEIERKCKYSSALTVQQHCINAALNDAISIIRKHFGKE